MSLAYVDPFAPGCPVCGGSGAEVDCACIVERSRRKRQIQSCYQAIRLIFKLTRTYQLEGYGKSDVRIRTCMDRVAHYREQVRKLRAA